MLIALIFQARGGGVQRTQITLAYELKKNGSRVTVIMPLAKGPFLSQLLPKIEIVDLDASTSWGFVLQLAKYLRRSKPDCVLASQHHVEVYVAVARRWHDILPRLS